MWNITLYFLDISKKKKKLCSKTIIYITLYVSEKEFHGLSDLHIHLSHGFLGFFFNITVLNMQNFGS